MRVSAVWCGWEAEAGWDVDLEGLGLEMEGVLGVWISKIEGIQRERSKRMAGRQAQIVATQISMKDQIAGITLSTIAQSALIRISESAILGELEERLAGLIIAISKVYDILESNHACNACTAQLSA